MTYITIGLLLNLLCTLVYIIYEVNVAKTDITVGDILPIFFFNCVPYLMLLFLLTVYYDFDEQTIIFKARK